MASRGVVGRIGLFLALIGVVALASAYLIVSGRNPLPAVGTTLTGWLEHAGSLSRPEAAWTQRLDDQPTAATVVGSAVVFITRGGAQARDAGDGRTLWSREAEWAAIAGESTGVAVVILGTTNGYDAVDPASGTVRWHDAGLGVWAYRNALLSLSCPAGKDCALSARSPGDGARRWTVALPADARRLDGAHVFREDLPPLLGLPVNGRIQVVDTANGSRLADEASTADTRVAVMGGRIIRATAERRGDTCRSTVEARDARSGRVAWRRGGYDLGTASGAGCEQRRDPAGAGRVLLATRGDDRPVILSTTDGRDLWTGAPEESVLATDGRDAVVRAGGSVRLVNLDSGRTVWVRPAPGDVTLTPHAVVAVDGAGGRIVAYDRGSGSTVVDVESDASVLATGPDCLIAARGRTVGLLRFGTRR